MLMKAATLKAGRSGSPVTSGGGSSIGATYNSWLDAERIVERGLPFRAIQRLASVSGLTFEQIKRAARLSAATFARRRQSGVLLPEESERVLRLSRLFERAVDLFQNDRDGARQWLTMSIPALADRSPLDLARTEVGAREVEDLIGRIQHGVIS
jgi:putative toxin-antitoxin system antitoxin component (TIGR02293 family)